VLNNHGTMLSPMCLLQSGFSLSSFSSFLQESLNFDREEQMKERTLKIQYMPFLRLSSRAITVLMRWELQPDQLIQQMMLQVLLQSLNTALWVFTLDPLRLEGTLCQKACLKQSHNCVITYVIVTVGVLVVIILIISAGVFKLRQRGTRESKRAF
ncbi:hypothetical protein E3U43_002553, partial [Larimichthys crocea]